MKPISKTAYAELMELHRKRHLLSSPNEIRRYTELKSKYSLHTVDFRDEATGLWGIKWPWGEVMLPAQSQEQCIAFSSCFPPEEYRAIIITPTDFRLVNVRGEVLFTAKVILPTAPNFFPAKYFNDNMDVLIGLVDKDGNDISLPES